MKKFELGRNLAAFVGEQDKKENTAFGCAIESIFNRYEVISLLNAMQEFGFSCEVNPNYPRGEKRKSELRLFSERFKLTSNDSSADMSNGKRSRGSKNDGPPKKRRKSRKQSGVQQPPVPQISSAPRANKKVACISSKMPNSDRGVFTAMAVEEVLAENRELRKNQRV